MRAALYSLIAFAASFTIAAHAGADETTGTWTGRIEMRANYYWETSTRVVAPEVRARLDSPDGVRIDGGYLIDAITSASIAAGVQEDIRFTEVRNQGSLGISREFDLGEAQLRLGTQGRISHEPDYLATMIRAYGTLALNQRTTTLGLNLTYIHDQVGAVLRGAMPRSDDTGRDLSDRGLQGQLEGVITTVSWNQILSPVLLLSTAYQLVYNFGYLHNPYRQAAIDEGLRPEQHPNARVRQTLSGRLAYFLVDTRTAFHLLYRVYIDDWDVAALNPGVRIYQMITNDAVLRLRYRYYDQVDSFFFAESYTGEPQFVTADPKMSRFRSHLVGAQLRIALRFLERTPLSFLQRGWFDLNFNMWLQTSRFGDAVLAQAGLQIPF